MSDNITKSSKIRFAGFTDAWEQRQLGDEFKKVNERNDGSFGKEHWISVAKMYFQDPEKVQSNNIDTRTYVMREGDIAFEGHPNAEFKFGRFVANDIGAGVVSELFPIYRHTCEYDNNYWKHAIQIERIMAPIFTKSITSSGNSSNKLDEKHFLRESIFVPSIEEQHKIGDLFKNLDNFITLHQRSYDKLVIVKKSMLEKMFPKDGADVPEIRFAGFTDAWEQRRLGEMLEKVSAPVELEKELMYKQIGIRSHGKGIFYKESVTGESIGNKRVFWVEPDSLILNIVFAWEQAVARTTEKEVGMIASHRFPMYRMKRELLDLDFIVHFFLTLKGKQLLESASPGGAGRNKTLGQKEFESLRLKLPSCDEQHKIGEFIDTLDDTITLHQRELELLKDMKKSLLQQMFV
ncbi:restriction endonuclease subunit S [Paenibacillus sp. FSL R7-0204]|uniref:restriction endonuclease subunit S n=1 Tax=Paenibacillus sp. FSL R7-0204 TaxID=2921675 RepID=UPI0030FA67C9